MKRRDFLQAAGISLGAATVTTATTSATAAISANSTTPRFDPGDWSSLRDQFPLTRDYIHLATFLLASHPAPVTRAIEAHRRAFDENPADYWHEHYETIDGRVSASAAAYMGGKPHQIALTDSTTMGLALVYSGLKLNSREEILQTTHDHYSTDLSLQKRAERTGAKVRRIALYDDPARVSVDQVVGRLQRGISDATRVVACTWVHSSTGVKLPIRDMAAVVRSVNAKRDEADQIIFCVDGVHGFGIEDVDVSTLGCDFFIAGTHKWIFGPRGTGLIWGSDRGWARARAVIPSLSDSYNVWLGLSSQDEVPVGEHMSPGGFHSFEHRWALPAAFEFHLAMGKKRVQKRIHQLNTQTKEGLAEMSHVRLYTPHETALSSGLVCFDVDGVAQVKVVEKLHQAGIIASSTPYRESYARFAPSLINNPGEIDRALAVVAAMG